MPDLFFQLTLTSRLSTNTGRSKLGRKKLTPPDLIFKQVHRNRISLFIGRRLFASLFAQSNLTRSGRIAHMYQDGLPL